MDYDAVKIEIAKPAYSGRTDTQIATTLQSMTVSSPAQKAILAPSQIINAIVFADLAALTQLQVLQLTLLLQGGLVDVSAGTIIRSGIQAIFSGKTTTLNNLAALVAPFDNPTVPFARQGSETITADVVAVARATK